MSTWQAVVAKVKYSYLTLGFDMNAVEVMVLQVSKLQGDLLHICTNP